MIVFKDAIMMPIEKQISRSWTAASHYGFLRWKECDLRSVRAETTDLFGKFKFASHSVFTVSEIHFHCINEDTTQRTITVQEGGTGCDNNSNVDGEQVYNVDITSGRVCTFRWGKTISGKIFLE